MYVFVRIRQKITSRRITAITVLRGHYSRKSEALRNLIINIENRRIDSQRVIRNRRQTLDIKWRPGFRIARNSRNVIRPENKDVAATAA